MTALADQLLEAIRDVTTQGGVPKLIQLTSAEYVQLKAEAGDSCAWKAALLDRNELFGVPFVLVN